MEAAHLRVSVNSHRVDDSGPTPFALYRITSHETNQVHTVERRWSDLRALYYEMGRAWRVQLRRQKEHDRPSFYHHAYRRSRLDPTLLSEREREMESLLAFYIAVLDVSLVRSTGPDVIRRFLCEDGSSSHAPVATAKASQGLAARLVSRAAALGGGSKTPASDADGNPVTPVDPPYHGQTELTEAALVAACDAPTARERYFTPQYGWPNSIAADSRRGRARYCQLLQDLSSASGLLSEGELVAGAAPAPVIGELSVEVLEAAGLPNLDTFSLTDPYAVVVVEGYAARTSTVDDCLDPKWHAECPRAFRFPLRRAHASLFVALLDDDGDSAMGALDDDDPIGRAVIQLGSLPPRGVIDAWWPLSHRAVGERPGARGHVRLRLQVTWVHDRHLLLHPAAMLQWHMSQSQPECVLHLTSRRALHAVDYAYHGAWTHGIAVASSTHCT